MSVLTFALLLVAYLLGSIPFGLLLTRIAGVGDIRQMGSGNIGATNVLRTGKKGLAVLTLVLDMGKGVVAVWLAQSFTSSETIVLAAGLVVLLGHLFPVWLKFKGGKGVATVAGVIFALAWPVGIAVAATWVLVAFLTRYSSLAALAAAALAPLYAWLLPHSRANMPGLLVLVAVIIFWKHKANIHRLLKQTETKIGHKEKTDELPSAQRL